MGRRATRSYLVRWSLLRKAPPVTEELIATDDPPSAEALLTWGRAVGADQGRLVALLLEPDDSDTALVAAVVQAEKDAGVGKLPKRIRTITGKDRLTILDVLCGGREHIFRLNAEALDLLEGVALSQATRLGLSALPWDKDLDAATLEVLLALHLPNLGEQARKWIYDALAVAAYHAETEWPVVRLLVCDDAPQWTWLSEKLGLCWVHEGRHYKKLTPYVAAHREIVEQFLTKFWQFYDRLLAFRDAPTVEERERLAAAFDELFSRKTEYWALNERIAKTRAKKATLLAVLEHPEIPLHNNGAELAARQRVRKRDVSFGPRTAEGARAWDTFMSLADTTRKLGVSFYHYIHDRIRGAKQMPPLADLIRERAQECDLGASWASA